mgnify:CR=1 FL=1
MPLELVERAARDAGFAPGALEVVDALLVARRRGDATLRIAELPPAYVRHPYTSLAMVLIDRGAVPVGMGMCGGPVLEAGGACVGMVEGVVPTSDHPLSDHASYIAALDLLPLVDDARRALAARADVPRDAPSGALRDGLA